ncbi:MULTISPECIES: DUF3037 domain-containing protein [Aquimarina]|uniref:DUF3037 domain-containing protein n=1 Tax=Aquimarina algiphila TaxID=2047982 RepID=A0A554VPX9_9FLAO|nr:MULTISPECIES: DUF3037 domain-containing protein [Aquimarina]TSE10550.1 DUF3037 domain-containing protein [Aquimarina algiphila]
MQDKVTFEFAVIRFVPKVEREEFFNIGVILFCKRKKFLGVKYHVNKSKFEAFSNDFELKLLEEYLKSWKLICKGQPSGGAIGEFELADRFRWLAASRSTVIQSSKTHPGLCSDPEKELEDLFERYVL